MCCGVFPTSLYSNTKIVPEPEPQLLIFTSIPVCYLLIVHIVQAISFMLFIKAHTITIQYHLHALVLKIIFNTMNSDKP